MVLKQVEVYGKEQGQLDYFSKKEELGLRNYLSNIALLISEIDEYEKTKIPPFPTIEIIELGKRSFNSGLSAKDSNDIERSLCKEFRIDNSSDALFVALMVAIQELTEDGNLNTAVYAECKDSEHIRELLDSFVCFNALQCGEMSIKAASWLMKEYGGWEIINVLRSIFVEGRSRKNPESVEDILSKLQEPIKQGLLNTSISRDEIQNETTLIMNKIRHLFSGQSYTARTMPNKSTNSNIKPLITSLERFKWKYLSE